MLLTNAAYAGDVTYAGSDEHGNPRRGRRKPVELFEGKHEAPVSLELFRKVQTVGHLRRYYRSTTLANPARIYPLTGVLYCAAQHSPLRGIAARQQRQRQPLLRGSPPPTASGEDRVAPAQPARDWIEQKIQDLVTSIRLPADWRSRILTYRFYNEGTDEIKREKLAIRERLRRTQELYRDGDTTREQFERVKAACLRDLRALAPAATPTGGEALALLDNLPALWVALTADEQKTFYRLIFSAMEVCDQAIVAIEARRAVSRAAGRRPGAGAAVAPRLTS